MTIRIGFLGAGFISRFHAGQLAHCTSPHVIAAVFDPVAERRQRFAERERCVAADSVEDVIERSDAVFVCSWTSEHLPLVRAAAQAGVHVFCEKPLAPDLAGAVELAAIVARSGVVNSVGLVLRSSPALLALRELIGDEGSGRVMNVVFRDDQYLPIQGIYGSDWRADPSRAGSGTLLEHSIHDVDVLEWLFGPAVSVSATSAAFHGIGGIEDSVAALVSFADGQAATLTSVWHDVLSRPSQRRMEVFCERALCTLEGDVFGPVRRQGAADGDEIVLEGAGLVDWLVERGVELVSAEEQFLRRVAVGGPSPSPTVDEALRAHVVVDAMYRSAAAGGAAVTVDPASLP